MSDTKFRISLSNIEAAMNSITSTCRFVNTQVVYLIYDSNEEVNCALASGNELGNLVVINIKGVIDYAQPFTITPIDVNKLGSIVRNCHGIFLTVSIPETKINISISSEKNNFTIGKMNLNCSWIQKILDTKFQKYSDTESPISIEMANDDFGDLRNASSGKFSDVMSNKDVVFIVLSRDKLTLFRSAGTIVSFIKQKVNIKDMPKDLQLLSLSIPCLTIQGIIDPFIKSKLASNKVTIYNRFVKIEKDDNSGLCIFTRDTTQRIPLNGIRVLLDNSSKVASIDTPIQDFKKFVGAITALLDNSSQPIDIELSYLDGWKMSSSHATSISHTSSEFIVGCTLYAHGEQPIAEKTISGSMTISNVSPKRIIDGIDYLKGLTQNIKSNTIDNKVFIDAYRGPIFNGVGKSHDYLRIGTADYFIIIACDIVANFEGINLPSPAIIQR